MNEKEHLKFLEGDISDVLNSSESTLSQSIKDTLEGLRWTPNEIENIDKLVTKLKTIPGCFKIWLYGSMARGTQDSNPLKPSDIDLAVEIEKGVYQEDLFRKNFHIEGVREVQLNFIPVGYDELTRDSLSQNDFTFIYGEEEDVERVMYHVDYVTVRSSWDAHERLRDQIVLWFKQ